MAEVNLVALKRNYTRTRNILKDLEPVIIRLKEQPLENYTDEFIASTELVLSNLKGKSDNLIHNRDLLEANIENEADLEVLVTEEHETFFNRLGLLSLEIEGRIKEFQCKKMREEELSRENDERMEREFLNDREEREHRTVLEQMDLRRLEIQRLVPSTSSVNNGNSALPKINLLKFSGELEKYQEFFDNFMSLVDSRTDLSDNVKLHYLKGQVLGKAAMLIEGIRITNDNYKVALGILREEFGTPQLIHHKIYNDLEKIYLRSSKAEETEEFYRKIELNLKLLENQGVDIGDNQLLSSLLFKKLPHIAQDKLVTDHGAQITVIHIRSYIVAELHKRRVLESLNPTAPAYKAKEPSQEEFTHTNTKVRSRFTTESMVNIRNPSNKRECSFCKEDHYEDQCVKFKTAEDRRKQIGNKCFICLSSGHLARLCNLNYRCYHCSKLKAHHRSLCPSKYTERKNWDLIRSKPGFNSTPRSVPVRSSQTDVTTSKSVPHTTVFTSCALKTVVYMQTAVIQVKGKNNEAIQVRAILDTASSNSYVSEKLQKLLGLETGKIVPMNIYTFGALEPKQVKAPEVCLDVITSEDNYKLKLFVVPTIVCSDNKRSYDQDFLQKLNENYTLSDRFILQNPSEPYDVLLGVDYYVKFFLPEKIQVSENLFLYNTVFGHVLSGTTFSDKILPDDEYVACSSLFTKTEFSVDPTDNINKLWDLQTIGIKENSSISDDDLALQSFETTLSYKDNRYHVELPWKNDSREVQSNYGLAVGRLKSLIKRHSDDGILKVCQTTLEEQLNNGILEKVPNDDLDKNSCYFPYHAVIKNDSNCTTKIRFVMDASARQNRSKPSLNDLLYRGPVLLENLCSLLLRFRLPKYGLIADIEKAFLNIGLNKDERDYTRILWLKDVTMPVSPDNILVLRHARLPFGVVSSPFLLSCVIRTHLTKYPNNPVVEQLQHNIYMDNILCGVDCESDIDDFVSTARNVFSDASLNLREWASNHPISLNTECKNPNRVQNTLGMLWDTQEDTLSLKFQYEYKNEVICKRLLLSVLASFFDILGLWTPIIMPLKVLVQSAWIQKKDWDNELETQDKGEFLRIVDSMNYVQFMPVVKEIKSASFSITYRYIPTVNNPADIACRGSSAMDLVDSVLWWKGPAFLSTDTLPEYDFPAQNILDEEVLENKPTELNLVAKTEPNNKLVSPLNIDECKYNSFKKLVNVTSYVKKFINLCRGRQEFKGPISLAEYKESKVQWLKYIQTKYFSSTSHSLTQGESDQISLQLRLELDQDGILICKGRFRELEYEGKGIFPVLLPRNCHLTDIIVTDVHRSCFHNGTSQTLATLRLEYWVTQGRSEVKKILRNCVNCKKFRQGPYKQPEFCFYPNYRVQRNVAFEYSSVDMFGPLTIQEGKELMSVHGLIFVCMTTRAIHIEILDSENTTDFLLAFKRFISRKNVCKQILSDNAIQFKLLSQVCNTVYGSEVSSYLNQKGIKFTFTSPLSPWEGGLYERLIGSTKQCLRKTLGHLLLSKTQLNTILIEIENVINSRPLGYVGDEEMMITPNHFLGIKSDSLGPEYFEYDSRGKSVTFKNLVSLWKKGSSYLDLFWRAWVKQYLNALRERKQVTFKQGRTSKLEPRIGEVVLIKDSNLTRFNWPHGTIVKLNRGKDNFETLMLEQLQDALLRVPFPSYTH